MQHVTLVGLGKLYNRGLHGTQFSVPHRHCFVHSRPKERIVILTPAPARTRNILFRSRQQISQESGIIQTWFNSQYFIICQTDKVFFIYPLKFSTNTTTTTAVEIYETPLVP